MSSDEGVEISRIEARELLEQIENSLLDLAQNPGDKELVATVFRALHTLIGSGAMFGFDALAGFTHHCETAFERVRKGEVPATRELAAAVLNAMDHMRALAEKRPVAAGEGDALLAALEHVVGQAAPKVSTPRAAQAGGETQGLVTWHIRFTLGADVLVNGTRPLPMLDELRALGACRISAITTAIPALDALVSTECYLGWDVELTTDKPRAAIEDIFMFVIGDMNLEITAASPAEMQLIAKTDDPVAAPEPEAAAARYVIPVSATAFSGRFKAMMPIAQEVRRAANR